MTNHHRYTCRWVRAPYPDRQAYTRQPFTADDILYLLRDIYRGWRIDISEVDGEFTFIARWPVTPWGAARALWALLWHRAPQYFALELLWGYHHTRAVDLRHRSMHRFVFGGQK